MYVLPTSTTEALLEYTFRTTFAKRRVRTGRKNTSENSAFTRNNRKEQGSIPMTCYPFGKKKQPNV
jgi:lycopene beta-cyclase